MEDGIEPRQTCRNFPKGEDEQVCDIGIGTVYIHGFFHFGACQQL